MSWQAVTWVLENSVSRVGSRLVLLSIASHANREGHSAFPSLKTIAIEAHLSKVQVIHCISELETLGELVVVRGGVNGRGNVNHYTLAKVEKWVNSLNPSNEGGRVNSAFKRVKSASKRVNRTLPEPSLKQPSIIQPYIQCKFCLFSFPKRAFEKHQCRRVAI